MEEVYHFTYRGKEYGYATKVRFTKEFYMRQFQKYGPNSIWGTWHRHYVNEYQFVKPSMFYHIKIKEGKTIWNFFDFEVDDLVPDRDIKEIVHPVYYVKPKTDKEKIQEKKEKGLTWSYIWPGTLVYIFCMLIVIPIFNERVWGWIAATIVYRNYYYEQMTR